MTPDLSDDRFNPRARVTEVAPGVTPTYYDCGICGAMHDARWDGDCRQDNARFSLGDLDDMHGESGWNEIGMDEIEDWRAEFRASRRAPGDWC